MLPSMMRPWVHEMSEQESARIRDLERRVDVLTNLVIAQVVILGAYFLRFIPVAAFGVLLLLPILAFTHKKLPALARKCGRLFSSSHTARASSATTPGDDRPAT